MIGNYIWIAGLVASLLLISASAIFLGSVPLACYIIAFVFLVVVVV